jgi:hypothetical protein
VEIELGNDVEPRGLILRLIEYHLRPNALRLRTRARYRGGPLNLYWLSPTLTPIVVSPPDEVSRDEKTNHNLRNPHLWELWKVTNGRGCEGLKTDSTANENGTNPRPLRSPTKTEIAVER